MRTSEVRMRLFLFIAGIAVGAEAFGFVMLALGKL